MTEAKGRAQAASLSAREWLTQSPCSSWRTEVTVLACHNLPGVDKTGTSDPFMRLGGMCSPKNIPTALVQKQTKTIKKTCNPEYNETFTWDSDLCLLHVEVWDWNRFEKDHLIAKCDIKLYEDEDMKEFPKIDEVVKVSRKFPEGGSVDLEIKPSYEPKTLFRAKVAEKTKGECLAWPEHTVKLSSGTLKFRLPKRVEQQPKPLAPHVAMFQSPKPTSPSERSDLIVLIISETPIPGEPKPMTKEDMLEVGKGIVEGMKKEKPLNKFIESGLVSVAGNDTFQHRFWIDYTASDPGCPFSGVADEYAFYSPTHRITLTATSMHSLKSYEHALENHHEKYANEWVGILHSITFTPK